MTEQRTKERLEHRRGETDQACMDVLYLASCAVQGIVPQLPRVQKMDVQALYHFSRFHAITNIVYEAVLSAYDGKLPEDQIFAAWREERDKAAAKNLLLDAERTALLAWMEQNEIWYLPLKGCILKTFYPKSGMRQMADNDILFDERYQRHVRDWFVARGFEVKAYQQGNHDCYLKKPVYNFEMHTALFSDAFSDQNRAAAEYYREVRSRLLPENGKRFGMRFREEDFYVYITAHAWKHYSGGGTGLRTLLDNYVYLTAKEEALDWEYIRGELEKLQIHAFEEQMRNLVHKIFANPETFSMQDLSGNERQMLIYYSASGTYGTTMHHVRNKLSHLAAMDDGEAVSRIAKCKYLWRRLFPGREFMENWCADYAPFFVKYKRLMPAAVIWRLLYKGTVNAGKWMREIRCVIRA